MKNSWTVSAVVSSVAVAFGQGVFAQDASSIIEMSHKAFNAALVRADVPTLDSMVADTYVFTDPSGRVTEKKELLQAFRSGSIKIESQEFRDEKVHMYGNTAVETGELTSKAHPGRARLWRHVSIHTCVG